MSSVTKYTVISHPQLEQFLESVNAKIKDGWQPYGSFICHNEKSPDGKLAYYQAMVVHDELGEMRADVKRDHEL